jgi:hypothetical protein
LQENKAQNFWYKKSWVKLMLFGFSAKYTFAKFEMAFWPEMAF